MGPLLPVPSNHQSWRFAVMMLLFVARRPVVHSFLVQRSTHRSCTAAFSSNTETISTTPLIPGIETIEAAVLQALQGAVDLPAVARANAEKKVKKLLKKQPDLDVDAYIAQAVAHAPTQLTRADTAVTLATQRNFGDYQSNAALALGGRSVAQHVAETLALDPTVWQLPPTIAGPGFLNLSFQPAYVCRAVRYLAAHDYQPDQQSKRKQQRIVIDYSSPNIAKDMHVGHLRSTVIGDCLARVLELQGHAVVRLNHVGDWGTQFGMLVTHMRDSSSSSSMDDNDYAIGDLVVLYRQAKQRFDAEPEFRERARQGVVDLQAGNPESLEAWKALCAASRKEFQSMYDVLGIDARLEERGESFYNSMLPEVVQDLEDKGLAVESNGAKAVFLDGYANRDGSPLPMLVQKSDGGFNYATTDLAAIRHRVETEKADRVLYVTDAGQSQHFQMVFKAAKQANYVPDNVSLEHVPFGLVQGEDGKKFATRSGDTVKLQDLLTESVNRAKEDMRERKADDLSVAETVGIAAVKYADLSMNRESNYRFSYERMLSLNGNTAPYMLYSYARICGILRKATGQTSSTAPVEWPTPPEEVLLDHPAEMDLARHLVQLPDILSFVERDLYPNRLCEYLFSTAQLFNQFYEQCSVNQAETPAIKESRLALCTATARTLRLLLHLLGIPVVEKL